MDIGIIGAGWLGSTVGKAWVQAGHQVLFSSRSVEKQRRAASRLGQVSTGGSIEEAAAFGEVVLVAVPYRALAGIGEALKSQLAGKVVLDACNPYPPDPAELTRTCRWKTWPAR